MGSFPICWKHQRGRPGPHHWPLPQCQYTLSFTEILCTVLEAIAGLWRLRPPTYSRSARVIIEDSQDSRRH